jgi:hypothetical protein
MNNLMLRPTMLYGLSKREDERIVARARLLDGYSSDTGLRSA